MKFRSWLNIFTLVFIVVVLFLAREHLVQAWHLLGSVNIWVLLLLVPVQIFSYYAGGAIFFTYLRARGQLRRTSDWQATRMALELNFVNHVFPSGGVAGISYMVWRLGKLGVKAGQATMAQIMRYAVTLGAFFVLLAAALLFVAVDGRVSNGIAMAASIAVTSVIFLVVFASFVISSEHQMRSFARWLARTVNLVVKKVTFGRVKKDVLSKQRAENFFLDFHEDFLVLKSQKKLLVRPIVWAFVFNLADLVLFMVTFLALGVPINPAVLLLAYGAASVSGLFVPTPGGAGAYETIMVGVLVAGGVGASTAFAGVILTRTVLMIGTLATGYVFYHRSLRKYGKPKLDKKIELVPDRADIKEAEEYERDN